MLHYFIFDVENSSDLLILCSCMYITEVFFDWLYSFLCFFSWDDGFRVTAISNFIFIISHMLFQVIDELRYRNLGDHLFWRLVVRNFAKGCSRINFVELGISFFVDPFCTEAKKWRIVLLGLPLSVLFSSFWYIILLFGIEPLLLALWDCFARNIYFVPVHL